jgi:WD40 repeat protein
MGTQILAGDISEWKQPNLPQHFALFAPDSGRILTASSDKTARLWNRDGKPLATLQAHTRPVSMTWRGCRSCSRRRS